MPLRVADAVAVLDQLGIERAHFIGQSWGGRLGFGIGEHAPQRVRSLVIGGNQPYAWPDSPLVRTVTEALSAARTKGMEALVGAFEDFWQVRFPGAQRARWLDNDPAALAAARSTAMDEGAIAEDLRRWQVRCLIFLGAADLDFLDGARRAVDEIPNADLLVLAESDHYAAHVSPDEVAGPRYKCYGQADLVAALAIPSRRNVQLGPGRPRRRKGFSIVPTIASGTAAPGRRRVQR
jgi:pimeloyl-ACP methyl ester carboxylesterase